MKKSLIIALLFFTPLLAACTTRAEDQTANLIKGVESSALTDGTYAVNSEASTLYWEAFKAVGGHMGGIDIDQGELLIKEGLPKQGSFVIDMNSITCTDIEDESRALGVVNHLKADDFFAVADFPTARFDITQARKYKGEGDYDFEIEGDLSLKDITQSVTLFAKIQQSGGRLTAHAIAEVDRTQFGVNFRSGTFFEDLGDKLIKDEFILEMELVANRL